VAASLARITKRLIGTDALNLPAAKFFKSALSFCKPQRFGITLNLIVNRCNQALRKLDAISQRELHRISRKLIQVRTHAVRIAERCWIDNNDQSVSTSSAKATQDLFFLRGRP
jgi:hypothetical protein